MRWPYYDAPKGTIRERIKFALFPVRLSNDVNCWLEHYYVKEQYDPGWEHIPDWNPILILSLDDERVPEQFRREK